MYELTKLPISQWAEEDRPREKLILKGKAALSNAELVAILIGSGTPELSAVDLSKGILAASQNDINQLAKLSIEDLKKFNGIGEAKAVSIISALELGRRRKPEGFTEKARIRSSQQIYDYLAPFMLDLDHEQFWVLFLNQSNVVIKREMLSAGGINATIVDVRLIFKKALELTACAVILAHNHPSGNPKPSDVDIRLTKNVKAAGRIMNIEVLDHLIFTDDKYYSFSDEQ